MAADSSFQEPIRLGAAPKGASVLVLGAGIAGMVAAYELRNAGYRVQVLEYNSARRRSQLDAARRRPLHRAGRRDPGVSLRSAGSTSIPVRGACRITIAAC